MRRGLCILFFLLSVITLRAQDTIRFTSSTRRPDCNGASNGKIEVTVQDDYPPYTYVWSTGATTNVVEDLPAGTYTLTITDAVMEDTTVTISLVERTCAIGPALVFTPNADGINDTWTISNIQFYPDNDIVVFNRWGQLVFKSHGAYEEWDGRDLLGQPVPDNAYFYVIQGNEENAESEIKGTVNILR